MRRVSEATRCRRQSAVGVSLQPPSLRHPTPQARGCQCRPGRRRSCPDSLGRAPRPRAAAPQAKASVFGRVAAGVQGKAVSSPSLSHLHRPLEGDQRHRQHVDRQECVRDRVEVVIVHEPAAPHDFLVSGRRGVLLPGLVERRQRVMGIGGRGFLHRHQHKGQQQQHGHEQLEVDRGERVAAEPFRERLDAPAAAPPHQHRHGGQAVANSSAQLP